MYTRNYDNMLSAYWLLLGDKKNFLIDDLKCLYIQDINGDVFYGNDNPVPMRQSWGNASYVYESIRGNYMPSRNAFRIGSLNTRNIWIGGDSKTSYCPNTLGVLKNKVQYTDINLYHPFLGGADNTSVDVVPQPMTVGALIFDKEKNKWTQKITREFKNISGDTIIVREIGYFSNSDDMTCSPYYYNSNFVGYSYSRTFLLDRQLLDEPIEVENGSYFKVSYTSEWEPCNINMKEKRVRYYTQFDFQNVNGGVSTTFPSVTGLKTGDKILISFATQYPSNVSEDLVTSITSPDINFTKITSIYHDENNFYEDFYKGDIIKEDFTTMPSYTYNAGVAYNSIYKISTFFDGTHVSDISFVDNTGLTLTADSELNISSDSNTCLLFNQTTLSSQNEIYQDDIDTCDYYSFDGERPYLNGVRGNMFMDCTGATEHTFKIRYEDYITCNKFNITTTSTSDLIYTDISV